MPYRTITKPLLRLQQAPKSNLFTRSTMTPSLLVYTNKISVFHNPHSTHNNIISCLRKFSTSSENDDDDTSGCGDQRSAACRLRLGIGDSPVRSTAPYHLAPWQPPKTGELKLDVEIALPENYYEEGKTSGWGSGEFRALARNSQGDLIGFVIGSKSFDSKIGLLLYAMKAAALLAKVLKDEGVHDGPLVYESTNAFIGCFHEKCVGVPGELLDGNMPEDIDDLAKYCEMYVGDPKKLLDHLDAEFPNAMLKERIQGDKIAAGLGA